MKNKQRGTTVILALLFLVACQEEIELKLANNFKEQIVLNSFFTNDSTIKVQLNKTSALDDSRTHAISTDKLYVTSKDSTYPLTSVSAGIYASTHKPTTGSPYEIVAFINDVIVTATTTIPYTTQIEKYTIYDGPLINDEPFLAHRDNICRLTFTPNPSNGDTTYYDIRVRGRAYEYNTLNTGFFQFFDDNPFGMYRDLNPRSYDPRVFAESQLYNMPALNLNAPVVLCKIIGNNKVDVEIEFDASFQNIGNEIWRNRQEVIIELRTVSKEDYKYYTSMLTQSFVTSGDDIFYGSGAVNVFSNVNNGLGVFAGYTSDTVMATINQSYEKF